MFGLNVFRSTAPAPAPAAPPIVAAVGRQLHSGPVGPPPPHRLRDDAGVLCAHADPDELRRLVFISNRRRAAAEGREYPEPIHG